MFQQTTPVFLSPPLIKTHSLNALNKYFLVLLLAISWTIHLHAKPSTSELSTRNIGDNLLADSTIQARICEGETYFFDGELLNTAGEYVAIYPLPDGSDSVVTLQLEVLPLAFTNLEATICEGSTFSFNGQSLSQSGTYTATLPAENGCDSTITLKLSVLQPIKTASSADICAGTFYVFQEDTLTQTGVYSIVLSSSLGCDSIVTLTLNVVNFFDVPLSATICAGDSYTFGDTSYSQSGVYVRAFSTAGGCDSVLTLTLTVLPKISTALSLTLCAGTSYNFQGDSLTEAGNYVALLTAASGCDSIVTLDLSFVTSYETLLEGSICTGGLYVFDTELLDAEGTYVHEYIAQGGCDSTVTLTLSVLPTSTGSDQATICANESFEYYGDILTEQGEYLYVLQAANGCDSTVTFTLNVLPAIETSIEATICSGDTYTFGSDKLSDAGTYVDTLSAINGCDSVITLTLNVLPVQQTSLSESICAGESFNYNGESITDAGTYNFAFSGVNGCDSTVTLALQVLPVAHTSLDVKLCAGETYEFDGNLISDSGTYTAIFTSENGCDSIVTLVLEILPVQNTAIEATICSNENYPFHGEVLSNAGIYTAVLTGANGCDSTIVLTLNVLPTQSSAISATICAGTAYQYSGQALTVAGDYSFIFGGENGCDSTVTISITVLPISTTNIAASICAGEAYDFNGELLTETGNYSFGLNAENGCDSIVTVSLTVLPLLSSTATITLCSGTSYVYNGDTLSVAGIYPYTFTGSNGCDSTATLVLDFLNAFETNLMVSICAGEAYVLGNDTLTGAGNYTQLLFAAGGCDSLVQLTLNVLPLSQSNTDVAICAGEIYSFNGLNLIETGTYAAVLTGSNGCDSTAILNLHVLPTLSSALETTICANEPYSFNGQILSDAGTYTAVLTGSNGCDSTVVLTLNVLPIQISSISATICANQPYDFYGQSLSQEGIYSTTFQGANGCDSIITLELTVLPLAQSIYTAQVCNGASFEYQGAVFTQSGAYVFVYPGAGLNGCDSIETLDLTIYPQIPNTILSASICVGEGYNFFGEFLTGAGTYTHDLPSVVGCDSTIELHLSVAPVSFTNLSASICAGEAYAFNGQSLTVGGTYLQVLQSVAGCDSTVTLNLTVNTVNTNISLQGVVLTAEAVNATFQWINCATNQPISGATTNFYTPGISGNYAVVVTQNGCTATSTCILVQVVSTEEPLSVASWTLQPNPASTLTQLVFSDTSNEDLWLEVFDLAGRSLYHQNVAAGTRQLDLNLEAMPDGILIVRLATEQEVSTKRLIKGQN